MPPKLAAGAQGTLRAMSEWEAVEAARADDT